MESYRLVLNILNCDILCFKLRY